MVDTTSIFPETSDGEGSIDFFNAFSVVWLGLYLMILGIVSGSPPFQLSPIIAVLVFFPVLVIGVGIPLLAESRYGNIFTSRTSAFQSSSVYVFTTLGMLYLLGGFSGGRGFSFLAQGNEFYTAFLANLPQPIKASFLINVAPIAETIFGFSLIYLLVGAALKADVRERIPGGSWTLAFLATLPVAVLFGLIHDTEAARLTTEFFVRAGFIMLIPMVIIYGEVLTKRDLFPFPAVMAFALAVHRGANLAEYGSYSLYFQDLLAAQGPFFLLSAWWIFFDALMAGLVAYGFGQLLVKLVEPDENPFTVLKKVFYP